MPKNGSIGIVDATEKHARLFGVTGAFELSGCADPFRRCRRSAQFKAFCTHGFQARWVCQRPDLLERWLCGEGSGEMLRQRCEIPDELCSVRLRGRARGPASKVIYGRSKIDVGPTGKVGGESLRRAMTKSKARQAPKRVDDM